MELTQELVRELLDYDANTGILIWKSRSPKHFMHLGERGRYYANRFNSKFANKEAFTSKHDFGYKQGKIYGTVYKSHRIIWLWMTGEWPKVIDHINGITGDNRWCNLRNVSLQENSKNISKPKTNTTGHVNIRSKKGRSTFEVQIKINNRSKQVGTFKTIDEAIKARDMAWIEAGFHKNHCSLNRYSKS